MAAHQFKQRLKGQDFEVFFPDDGYFVDHDRLVYPHLKSDASDRFYKVILGQGLVGFRSACRRRSHGVWFEILSRNQPVAVAGFREFRSVSGATTMVLAVLEGCLEGRESLATVSICRNP